VSPIRRFKIEFEVIKMTISTNSTVSKGSASFNLLVNDLPIPGNCSVDLLNGTSPDTQFTFNCSQWTDTDGYIVKYIFYAFTVDDPMKAYCIGESENEIFKTTLPIGYEPDGYNLYIFVQVVDNDNGFTQMSISEPIKVEPNFDIYDEIMDAARRDECYEMDELDAGNSQASIQKLLATSKIFNIISDAEARKFCK
jgi:hypothetical protein